MRGIDKALVELETLSPAQLRDRAARDLGTVAEGYGPDLLRLGLAYRVQARGGSVLPPSIAREIAAGLEVGAKTRSLAPLRAGTRLVREWQGRTHAVEVVGEGFLYRDRRYRSLSAIAREITGTAWSGPRFFALTTRVRNEA